MTEIERLRLENQRLSDQVKRLVTTERQLFDVQEHLDGQMSAYRQLYEIGKKFNATFDLTTILNLAAQFVLYELNFERCLVLMRQPGATSFSVETMDGYYDDAGSIDIARLLVPVHSSALAPLFAGLEQVLCGPDCDSGAPLTRTVASAWASIALQLSTEASPVTPVSSVVDSNFIRSTPVVQEL